VNGSGADTASSACASRRARAAAACACALALALLATAVPAGASSAPGGTTPGTPGLERPAPLALATLQECATATIPQSERSATFAGEMTALPGTVRMQMRIDLQERALEETQYRNVIAPGLGAWHSSSAGVKLYTHIQQFTNLSAPASYRGVVRFRWLGQRGRVLKFELLHTGRCEQPAPAGEGATAGAPAGAEAAAGGSGAAGSAAAS